MKRLLALLPAFCLTACLGANGQPPRMASAASVEYQLPITSAKIATSLILQSCKGADPVATVKAVVTPVANPNFAPEQRYRLYGADLASFTKNRQVALELYPHGAIKSINGGVSDRTGAIITNVLKIGAGLIGFAAAPAPPPETLSGVCNAKTVAALNRVEALSERIEMMRAGLQDADAVEAEQTRLAIDALASEVARLRTGHLSLTLEREIVFRMPFPEGTDGVVSEALQPMEGGMLFWKAGELSKWLVVSDDAGSTVEQFALAYCVRPATVHYQPDAVGCLSSRAASLQARENAAAQAGSYVETPSCYDEGEEPSCPKSLVFREPVAAVMVLVAANDDFRGLEVDSRVATQDLSISQWGSVTELPLDTGFGGNFSMSAGYTEFGRQTSFTWKSDAGGEAITGALSSIVHAASTARSALTTDLEGDKAEIERLRTAKALNELEFCRQVIEAGGFTCPAP